jgi:hypothetical protein
LIKKKTADPQPEYPREFFKSMKPIRFAGRGTRSVTLDADVAGVFDSSESVNTALRSAIKAMRGAGAKTAKTPAKRPAS